MKRYLFTMLLAVLLGIVLAIYSFNKFQEDDVPIMSNLESIYAFQIGVFKDFNNANTVAQKYGAILILDNDNYRVYLALSKNSLNLLKKKYDEEGISYYIKTIDVSHSFYEYLVDKENEINDSNYKEVMKDILKEYERSL